MTQTSILASGVNTASLASVVQELLQIVINSNKIEEIFKVNIKDDSPVNIVMNDYFNQSIVLNRNGQPVNIFQKNVDMNGNFLNVEKIKVRQYEAYILMIYGKMSIKVKMKKLDGEWIFVSSYIKDTGKRVWDFEF